MKLHRFYIAPDIELKHDFWLHDRDIVKQWLKVLRYRPGQEVVLFDGLTHDRLYRITDINEREAHMEHVTDFERKVPSRNIYLLWALLKKDKNDWVLQKCTELGVSHFMPLLTERAEKTGFNIQRSNKIVTEAAEQCGRSDIPNVREPIQLDTAVAHFDPQIPLLVCEQGGAELRTNLDSAGLLIGPEGGWSDAEKELFEKSRLEPFGLHSFTLRAETACVAAVTKLSTG